MLLQPENKAFKVLHLTFNWGNGGAAIGARRLYGAMKKHGVNCEMLVVRNEHPNNPEPTVYERPLWRVKLANKTYARLNKWHKTASPVLKSYNLMPTGLHKVINASDADIVQCHWLGANTISIPEFAKITKPVFWKLPDMWAISGAEHYNLPEDKPRHALGYTADSKQVHECGFDLNKWIWRYKMRHWRTAHMNLNIVCPSNWLAGCVRESKLLGNRPVRQIYNPIDTDLFSPQPREEALKKLGLEGLRNKKIISFGADGATSARRKGYHHLVKALEHLSGDKKEYALLVFGGPKKEKEVMHGIDAYSLGRIDDVRTVVTLYNASDVFVLPSERDNLPNVIKEAMVCGVPCVSFDIGGCPDMISHKQDGFLAKPFDPVDLAKGIDWVFANLTPDLKEKVRKIAVQRHNEKRAVQNYLDYYGTVLSQNEGLQALRKKLETT